ncbi:hypothetical protein, partial [Frankia torreyi]|uniref:hypothetical protein n=1 Tax=Frankia torreyi TaxID=1856 RepID=UPI001A7E986B
MDVDAITVAAPVAVSELAVRSLAPSRAVDEERELLQSVRARWPVGSARQEPDDGEILAAYRELRALPQNRRRLTSTLVDGVVVVLHGGRIGGLFGGAGLTDSPGEPADPWRAIQLELDPPDGLRVFGPADLSVEQHADLDQLAEQIVGEAVRRARVGGPGLVVHVEGGGSGRPLAFG